jgi:hypothetical protein
MDQQTPELQNNQAPIPESNKKLLTYASVTLALLILIGGGIWWYTQSRDQSPEVAQNNTPQTVSDEVASYAQPLFYFEGEKSEHPLDDISGLMFFIKPFDKKMNIAKPLKTHVTMEKPDGKKSTIEVALEVSPVYNGCYETDISKCKPEQLYFRQEPFSFYGYDNNFFGADQVGTWKLTSSNNLIQPFSFEIKGSAITSIFIEKNIGDYQFTERNDHGEISGYEIYSTGYVKDRNYIGIYILVKKIASAPNVAYDHNGIVPGNVRLNSGVITTVGGNKIKITDCGECDLDKGSTEINFSVGWPTKDGVVNMYGGVGQKYGDAEKEVVKQYLTKYPSTLK